MQEFQLWERGGVAAAAQSRNLYIAKKSVGYRPPAGVVGDVHQTCPKLIWPNPNPNPGKRVGTGGGVSCFFGTVEELMPEYE